MVVKLGGLGRFVFLRSFREHSKLCKCSTTCWLTPTLSSCLRCRALTGRVLALLLVRVNGAVLCCAVRSKESLEKQEGSPTNSILVGNYRLRRVVRWEKIPTMPSEVGDIKVKPITIYKIMGFRR